MSNYSKRWRTVSVEIENGVAWVMLNRPDKRNAMSPELNRSMVEALDAVELDDEAEIIVITGAGDAFSAGMDLKEYFREIDDKPDIVKERVRREASQWQWKMLRFNTKPTIAAVNGWCFGGAFTPLGACDLAIAADEALFGLSEINWGIPPGNLVSKVLADTMGHRQALYYIMTGKTFDGQEAARMGLVNQSVPLAELRSTVDHLAQELRQKNPVVLRHARHGFKRCREFTWEQNEDYLYAKVDQSTLRDPEGGRKEGLKQFLDEKSIKPGLQTYQRKA